MIKFLLVVILFSTSANAEVISMISCRGKNWPINSKVKYVDYKINQKTKNLTIHTYYYSIDDAQKAIAAKTNLYKIEGLRSERVYKIMGGDTEVGITTERLPIPDVNGNIDSQSSSYVLYPKKSAVQWYYYLNEKLLEDHSKKFGWYECEKVTYN